MSDANSAAPGFNKLFVMVPVMLAARKLDAEDPTTINYLRIAYGCMQSICVSIVLYTFVKASSLKNRREHILVPVPSVPFANDKEPNAKKKYTKIEYGAQLMSAARSLLGSTLFGICMTVGLHLYKGMAMGLAIQTVMGPFNLIENPLVKALLMGNGIEPQNKIFGEKTPEELTDDDEIVDDNGTVIPRQSVIEKAPAEKFEELMLDMWDAGTKASIPDFIKAIDNTNCNYRSKENGWTPLMVLSGLASSDGTVEGIKTVIALGGNPSIIDNEGWNALHWAAFHGSIKAAKELYEYDASLSDVKDKEDKLPLEIARQEANIDVAKYLEEVMPTSASTSNAKDDEGIRKRK